MLLRGWRGNRRLSQLQLAGRAGVSARHLSFVETGRARPTREMILRLAEELAVPLRARNALLLAGGFAPAYPEGDLRGPGLAAVLASLRAVLAGHEPYPAVLIDRHWTLVDANAGVPLLTAGAAPELLEPPVNVLRLSLHPDGMAPRIRNLGEWRAHILHRLDRQALATGDPVLRSLHDVAAALAHGGSGRGRTDGLVVPLRLRQSTAASCPSSASRRCSAPPLDVTLDELAVESVPAGRTRPPPTSMRAPCDETRPARRVQDRRHHKSLSGIQTRY
ncbi:helix-turn-helix transcriptional regulator [Amorphoplanes nipponensis]|uniref:helix-turn-helix domain-containing protein n=1 Tax=Actinoplanes nipponensis TaxID=135950 RepID=UPI0031EC401C